MTCWNARVEGICKVRLNFVMAWFGRRPSSGSNLKPKPEAVGEASESAAPGLAGDCCADEPMPDSQTLTPAAAEMAVDDSAAQAAQSGEAAEIEAEQPLDESGGELTVPHNAAESALTAGAPQAAVGVSEADPKPVPKTPGVDESAKDAQPSEEAAPASMAVIESAQEDASAPALDTSAAHQDVRVSAAVERAIDDSAPQTAAAVAELLEESDAAHASPGAGTEGSHDDSAVASPIEQHCSGRAEHGAEGPEAQSDMHAAAESPQHGDMSDKSAALEGQAGEEEGSAAKRQKRSVMDVLVDARWIASDDALPHEVTDSPPNQNE